MSKDSLINRWRPTKFSDVIGQDHVVSSYKNALADGTSHAFLFAGPPGTGKTTFSYLGAKYFKSSGINLVDVDAATYSGVDDFRALTETLHHRPLGGGTKSIIVDECQALSRQAWQSALKMTEKPPEWVRWFFCTTELNKVPDPIKQQRCTLYNLKPVRASEILDYLVDIAAKEQFDTPRTILELCAKESDGSPRKALSNLSVCYAIKDRKEAARLIADNEEEEGGSGFALAQALANGHDWSKIQPILEGISKSAESPETVRHRVQSYFANVVISNKNAGSASRSMRTLDAFSEPFQQSDGIAPLVLAVGRILFSV